MAAGGVTLMAAVFLPGTDRLHAALRPWVPKHRYPPLAREDLDSTITFSELMKFNILRTVK